MIDQLRETYKNNNQLILFAEAKNAGLIVFNGAIIIGMASLVDDVSNSWLWYLVIYVILMNILSAVVSMSSMGAQKLPKELKSSTTINDNYLFFGTISHMNPEEYLEKVQEKYTLGSKNEPLEYDMARQLIIISQIASRKFSRFNLALAFTMMSIITPLGYLIYHFRYNPNVRKST